MHLYDFVWVLSPCSMPPSIFAPYLEVDSKVNHLKSCQSDMYRVYRYVRISYHILSYVDQCVK